MPPSPRWLHFSAGAADFYCTIAITRMPGDDIGATRGRRFASASILAMPRHQPTAAERRHIADDKRLRFRHTQDDGDYTIHARARQISAAGADAAYRLPDDRPR